MRVSFETYTMVYKGNDESDLPMFERSNVKRVEGTVVDTVVLTLPNPFSDTKEQVPHFIVSLDDGTFTWVDIKECTKVGSINLEVKKSDNNINLNDEL